MFSDHFPDMPQFCIRLVASPVLMLEPALLSTTFLPSSAKASIIILVTVVLPLVPVTAYDFLRFPYIF